MIDKYDLFWKEPDVRYKIAGKYPFTTVRLHLMRCLVKEDKRKHTGGYLYASLERPFQLVPFSEKDKGDRIYQENMTPEEVEQERWFSADAATVRHHGAERAMDAICGPGEEALSPGSAAPLPHDEARTEDAEVTVAVNEPPAPQTAEAETLWQAVRDQILLQFPNYEQVSAAVRAAWGIAVDETHDQVTLVVGMTGQRQIAFIESRLMARFDNIATHTVGRPTHIQLEARPKPPD